VGIIFRCDEFSATPASVSVVLDRESLSALPRNDHIKVSTLVRRHDRRPRNRILWVAHAQNWPRKPVGAGAGIIELLICGAGVNTAKRLRVLQTVTGKPTTSASTSQSQIELREIEGSSARSRFARKRDAARHGRFEPRARTHTHTQWAVALSTARSWDAVDRQRPPDRR